MNLDDECQRGQAAAKCKLRAAKCKVQTANYKEMKEILNALQLQQVASRERSRLASGERRLTFFPVRKNRRCSAAVRARQ